MFVFATNYCPAAGVTKIEFVYEHRGGRRFIDISFRKPVKTTRLHSIKIQVKWVKSLKPDIMYSNPCMTIPVLKQIIVNTIARKYPLALFPTVRITPIQPAFYPMNSPKIIVTVFGVSHPKYLPGDSWWSLICCLPLWLFGLFFFIASKRECWTSGWGTQIQCVDWVAEDLLIAMIPTWLILLKPVFGNDELFFLEDECDFYWLKMMKYWAMVWLPV